MGITSACRRIFDRWFAGPEFRLLIKHSHMSAHHIIRWKGYEKIAFRFFLIYFFIQVVPLDWLYYKQVFAIDWVHLRYNDIFVLAHYMPQFIAGPQSFISWGIVAALAATGTIVWTVVDRNRTAAYPN